MSKDVWRYKKDSPYRESRLYAASRVNRSLKNQVAFILMDECIDGCWWTNIIYMGRDEDREEVLSMWERETRNIRDGDHFG